MTDVYLGLGSNVDPDRHLESALAALADRFGAVEPSRVYRNPAVGFVGEDFLNLVVRVRTEDPPRRVQSALREIERAAARDRRGPRWGPRTLDVDLLLYGNVVDPALRLPREDVLRDAHALCPLAELAPALRHPVTGRTMRDAWGAHRDRGSAWTVRGRPVRSPGPRRADGARPGRPRAAAE